MLSFCFPCFYFTKKERLGATAHQKSANSTKITPDTTYNVTNAVQNRRSRPHRTGGGAVDTPNGKTSKRSRRRCRRLEVCFTPVVPFEGLTTSEKLLISMNELTIGTPYHMVGIPDIMAACAGTCTTVHRQFRHMNVALVLQF